MRAIIIAIALAGCTTEPETSIATQPLDPYGYETQGCQDDCAWQSNCGIAVCSYCSKPNYFDKGKCISGVALSPKERARLDAEREMERQLGLGD